LPISRVAGSGGPALPVTRVQGQDSKVNHMWPFFLPDGRHFLYLATGEKPEDRWIHVADLDSEMDERLIAANSQPVYAQPGHILFLREGSLFAQRFDAGSRKIIGESVLLAGQIGQNQAFSYGAFSASATGMLIYRSGGSEGKTQTWIDRTGRTLGVVGPTGEMIDPEISPDEKRVAIAYGDASKNGMDIWLLDVARGTSSRFSFGPSNDYNPIWSGDGSRIYFVSREKAHDDIYQKPASGAGEQELTFASEEDKSLEDVSRDGRFLAYSIFRSAGTGSDLFVLPLEGERKPTPLLIAPHNEGFARFSPDGRFIAYVSDETGKEEVYVLTFPAPTGKWQISTNGGVQPRWRNDGREIYYLAPNSRIMAVPVKAAGAVFEAGMPADLFETGLVGIGVRNHYAVSTDGQRFLVGIRAGGENPPPVTFVLNWAAELKKSP